MKLLVLGVNHETAPVTIREKVAFSPNQLQGALTEIKSHGLVNEGVILSTCNRTEIYATLKSESTEDLRDWLHRYFELPANSIEAFLYQYTDLEAIKHIMRVSSGLNSLVLGEPQILGQIKDAYSLAHKSGTIHQTLNCLFQHIFKTAKQVRTDTAIGSSPVSVAFSAVALSKQFFGNLSQQTALLIGAGETTELVARHLSENHIGKLIIANRTLNKAHHLAEALEGYAISLNEITAHLHEADMIISSTASPDPILTKTMVGTALKKRRNKPIFMVDIAVPRDIEPSVGDFSDTYLYTVDDLQEIIEENKRSRKDAALEAEEIIELQAENFMLQYQATQQISPIIQSFRTHAYQLKEQALTDAIRHLEQGADPKELITKLANQLTNKILHTPTQNLHKAGLSGQKELVASAAHILLTDDKEAESTSQPNTTTCG